MRPLRFPRFWLSLWYAALAATVLFCLLPLPPIDVPMRQFDKVEHLAGYALLAAYAALLFNTRLALLRAQLGLLALGAVIEGLQSLVPWRSAEAFDVLANALGVGLGSCVAATPLARALPWIERLAGGRAASARNADPSHGAER